MANKEYPTSERIQLYARQRFLRLETPKAFDADGKPRWENTSLLDPSDAKGKQSIKTVLEAAAKLSKETYGTVPLAVKKLAAKFLDSKKVDLNDPANAEDNIKIAVADGDSDKYKDYVGYAGMFIVPAHNSKLKPDVANRKGLRVQPGEPQYPYDGCTGLTSITLWAQVGETQKKYGKRIGVNLRGVQFVADGNPFSQDVIEDEFQPLAEDATATGNEFD